MISWTCNICNKERPDSYISVFTVDTFTDYELFQSIMRQNILYCNDNPDCIEKVKTFRFDEIIGKEKQ